MLPASAVDIYIEGVLVMRGARNRYEFVTPELPDGTFKYRITMVSSSDSTRGRDFEVSGITAGKIIAVDLKPYG